MNRIKYFILFFSLPINLLAIAQSKYTIKNMHATFTVYLPGNIPVDRKGHAISKQDTIRIIYVESSSKDVKWNMAWKDDKNYSIVTTLITAPFIEIGINKITNDKMVLRASKGNKLWQLQLVPEEKKSSVPLTILPGEIILQGAYHSKKMIQKISKEIELVSPPSY